MLRAVDQLTPLELTVLDAVARARGYGGRARRCAAAVNAEPAAVDAALGRLRALALVWGTDDALRALSVLDRRGRHEDQPARPAAGDAAVAGYGPGPGDHAWPATSG